MTIILPALAVAFAALCIWLTVRIINRRERWAKQTEVGLAMALVGNPLSFGPACCLAKNRILSERQVALSYRPIVRLMIRPPEPVARAIFSYAEWWAGFGTVATVHNYGVVQSHSEGR